jgi:hypothetical protein
MPNFARVIPLSIVARVEVRRTLIRGLIEQLFREDYTCTAKSHNDF